jgi:hypothetical protein
MQAPIASRPCDEREALPVRGLIDVAAAALRTESPVFSRRNLHFAVQRANGAAMTAASFDAALRRRLARGPLPGLLPASPRRRSSGDEAGWGGDVPRAVLLVDRPVVRHLLTAHPAIARAGVAVVCVDGSPSTVVARLTRAFAAGSHAPVVYLHDAATVIYPFSIEPLATLARRRDGQPVVYRDLGLPPLGATARRFADAALRGDEPLCELEAIPPATLARYCVQAVAGLVP